MHKTLVAIISKFIQKEKFKGYRADSMGGFVLSESYIDPLDLITRPSVILFDGEQKEYIPFYRGLSGQENFTMQWWYKSHDKPLDQPLSKNEYSTLSLWIGLSDCDGEKVNLRRLLKGGIRNIKPVDLLATGFYIRDSYIAEVFEKSIILNNALPQSITFTRKSRRGSWDVVVSVLSGEIISVTTRLSVKISGRYMPDEQWAKKRFWNLTFKLNKPVLTPVDQYFELCE